MRDICIGDELFCYKRQDNPYDYSMTLIVEEIRKTIDGFYTFYGIYQTYINGEISIPYSQKMHAWVGNDLDYIYINHFDLGV